MAKTRADAEIAPDSGLSLEATSPGWPASAGKTTCSSMLGRLAVEDVLMESFGLAFAGDLTVFEVIMANFKVWGSTCKRGVEVKAESASAKPAKRSRAHFRSDARSDNTIDCDQLKSSTYN